MTGELANEWLLRRHAYEAIVGAQDGVTGDDVDMSHLRQLCSDGIPDDPPQLRPLMFDLLLGVIPLDRGEWKDTKRKQRQEYYALLKSRSRDLDSHTTEMNEAMRQIRADISRLDARYPVLQGRSRPRRSSRLYPLRKRKQAEPDASSSDSSTVKISREPLACRRAFFQHMDNLIQEGTPGRDSPPRITLSGIPATPPMSPTKGDNSESTHRDSNSVTLLSPHSASNPAVDGGARYDTHSEVLVRLLIVLSHSHNYDPSFASVIAPLYLTYARALSDKPSPTYAEEETYWAMSALITRMGSLWNDSASVCGRIGTRLKWADEHLYSILIEHDLDPASPLYSFRWASGLLAADLPLKSLIPLWDAILASTDPLDSLIDMCCSLLLASKKHLFRIRTKRGLWGDAVETTEVDFMQALAFLRELPLKQIGGIPAILGAYAAVRAAGNGQAFVEPRPSVPAPIPALAASRSISSKGDLASRLASLTMTVPAQKATLIAQVQGSLGTPPRQLMLQDKARRASNPISTPMGRSDTSSSASLEATLSPPPSTGLYRIGSRQGNESPGPRRTLSYENSQMAMLAIGLGQRRQRMVQVLPIIAAQLRRTYANYRDHVLLNTAQNALLAVGSGVVGVLDTSRGDLVATLSESTASTFLPTLHSAMTSHPEGRQIMRDRPIVSSATVDLDHLRSLRRGTLGREYVEWLTEGGLTPDSREKVRYIDSPTLAYTMLRYRQTHDLYHTLFSLPPTLPHELSLKVVELSNMSLPVAGLSSAFGPFRLSNARRAVWLSDWAPWALRVGREGKSLVGVYWEKRWAQGLGDLRQELGVYRNDQPGVESRWRGYRDIRQKERELRQKGEWVDEPESW